MGQLVAVYGTLRKGYGNHQVMKMVDGDFVAKGTTSQNFNMYHMGGFPSVSKAHSSSETPITVEVYYVEEGGLTGPLDRLEGYPRFYNRTKTPVILDDGTLVDAWLYHIDEETGPVIESGDWEDGNK
ncbi:putative AIG-2 protein [Salinivibrio phage CW02]|uniref:Putative AIG-2 protein n=1 Tax=Salinivibrio phage CW02 TaxID=1161935 RepID=H9D1E0_9CAUD|nr:gamma-glutamyl cyclotransferase [Salinivibrio phage CW02]AFE86182.1 putative AIG-2 protein [Salinivibrio phage CW02]